MKIFVDGEEVQFVTNFKDEYFIFIDKKWVHIVFVDR